MRGTAATILLAAFWVLPACGGQGKSSSSSSGKTSAAAADAAPRSASCPLEQAAPALLPGVTEAHRDPNYWFERIAESKTQDLDEVLLSSDDIENLNASYGVSRPGFFSQADLLAEVDQDAMLVKVDERFVWMQGKLDAGEYKKDVGPDAFSKPATVSFAPSLRVALDEVQLYCAPTSVGFYDSDATSKRINRNTCSAAHAQELIQVLAPWSGGMSLARTATSWGFIESNTPMTQEISQSEAEKYARGPYAVVSAEGTSVGDIRVPAHSRLPFAGQGQGQVLIAKSDGIRNGELAEGSFEPSTRPFTRRAVIEQALSYLGEPYGFGGLDGGIDCSRLQLDLFGAFGIQLPRFSGWQSKAGNYSIDVEGVSDTNKQQIIDQASESGVVIMHLPGHIMLYLGRDADGVPMAVHALSYYLDTCDTGEETAMVVGKVQVGGLELGRGTRKTALIERINRVSVLGKAPPDSIRGIAKLRPAAPVAKPSSSVCKKLPGSRLFVSPKRPERGHPMRVVATSRIERGPSRLTFYDPKGLRQDSILTETNGPPNGYIGALTPAVEGTWTVVLGDGDTQHACTTFRVGRRKSRPDWVKIERERRKAAKARRRQARLDKRNGKTPEPEKPKIEEESPEALAAALTSDNPIWKARRQWGPVYEDLFAAFTERLFDYPDGDDLTWPDLHTLLQDSERNILFDHFSKSEETVLKFVPDCADLPYTLRAYFAWKLRLPFGVHQCHRARDNRPPTCDLAGGNMLDRSDFAGKDEVSIFRSFVNYHVRRTVHSSSGRTAPNDDETDFYPVRLSRKTLRPGTLFTDPYGHLLVVVKWVDQGATGYGGLIGADAQPDGTIGRRRFWRGSFLFRPETHSGGAGFKAFRPWVYDRETKALVTTPNDQLKRNKTARFSREQYKGSESDFYDKMEAIINPRALDPVDKLRSLIDALEEQVTRRTTSVNTGEDFMKSRNFEPIDMPVGKKIFLTSGPWEDFSTPSRDWRLLIAIHTVVDFPDAVLRSPTQYGFTAENAEERVAELRTVLAKELASRPLPYTRSDGSTWELTLKDLVDRRVEFEMSYNPNDCPEQRWAAPKGSDEHSTCKRKAPDDQHGKMLEYRHWFSNRNRPAS